MYSLLGMFALYGPGSGPGPVAAPVGNGECGMPLNICRRERALLSEIARIVRNVGNASGLNRAIHVPSNANHGPAYKTYSIRT